MRAAAFFLFFSVENKQKRTNKQRFKHSDAYYVDI